MAPYQLFVGIDIAATSFTATWQAATAALANPVTLAQTPAGFQQLLQHLAATTVIPAQTLVVLEATGSYWIALAVALHQAGYHVSVVNPAHVHKYAKSLPRRAKTDRLDAVLLTPFARERHRQYGRHHPPAIMCQER